MNFSVEQPVNSNNNIINIFFILLTLNIFFVIFVLELSTTSPLLKLHPSAWDGAKLLLVL